MDNRFDCPPKRGTVSASPGINANRTVTSCRSQSTLQVVKKKMARAVNPKNVGLNRKNREGVKYALLNIED